MKPLEPNPKTGWMRLIAGTVIPENAVGWSNRARGWFVISSIDRSGNDGGFEYHLSISADKSRCSHEDAMRVLRVFGMDNAEEDNSGGRTVQVRHFWQAVKEGK